MAARFFADETDLALGRALARDRDDVVFPGHPDLPEVPRGALDDEWLPVIGRLMLVVITRDKNIRRRSGEKRAWLEHRVRGVVLTGTRSQTTADSEAIIKRHWAKIEALLYERPLGPWMYSLTADGLRELDLD